MKIYLKIDELGYIVDTVTEAYFNELSPFDPYYFVEPYPIDQCFIRPRYYRTERKFVEGEINEEILSQFKSLKIDNLNRTCDVKIELGFLSSNGHFYRTTRDDQINMMGQKDKLNEDATISEVQWKTEDSGYVTHTREDWLKVYREAFNYKETQIFKYNSLKQQVLNCKNIDEINAIQWV
ncbi:hypothetical protein V7128_01330 [Neobacillus vireti]|uniref:DUF4376 domain-containing protein n=1 Tax=Neobacillus vireti TaxID=220686 RepID=UPI002FFDFEDF